MGTESCELRLDQIIPGAVLASELRAADGQVIPGGSEITEAMLADLRQRGVSTLLVVAGTSLADDADAAAIDPALQRIRYIFRGAGDNAPLCELERQITAYRQRERS